MLSTHYDLLMCANVRRNTGLQYLNKNGTNALLHTNICCIHLEMLYCHLEFAGSLVSCSHLGDYCIAAHHSILPYVCTSKHHLYFSPSIKHFLSGRCSKHYWTDLLYALFMAR